MKKAHFLVILAFALAAPLVAHADSSMLRIICEGEDVGAEVSINGKFKGECPLDIQVQEGTLKLKAQKAVDGLHNPRLFEQVIRIGDGVIKKIEVHLGEAELNAKGRELEEKKRAEAERIQAEAKRLQEEAIRQFNNLFASVMVAVPAMNIEIGRYEVTQAQWQAVMGNNPSHFKGDNLPVESVSWFDVKEFISKLNQKTGKQYRLLTTSEWEFACFAGNRNAGAYCGSYSPYDVGWFVGNSNNQTHPVGQKAPNAYGLYDMIGNVWEWVEDSPPDASQKRRLRGSSYYDPQDPIAGWGGGGYSNNATDRNWNVGFRLAGALQ